MSQLSKAAQKLIKEIKSTQTKELFEVCLAGIKEPEEVQAVCEALLESTLNVSITIGRHTDTTEVGCLSTLLLASGRKFTEWLSGPGANWSRPTKFTLKGLDFSNSGFNDECANILSRALVIKFKPFSSCHEELLLSSTLEKLILSDNLLTYKGLCSIFKALEAGSRNQNLEYSHSSQSYFQDGFGGLKPIHSIPIRKIDMSNNSQALELGSILPADTDSPKTLFIKSLASFLEKNWTLVNLGMAGLNPGDWSKDDCGQIFSSIAVHNSLHKNHGYSPIMVLDLRNNHLNDSYIEGFSHVGQKVMLVDLRGNSAIVEMKNKGNIEFTLDTSPIDIPIASTIERPDDCGYHSLGDLPAVGCSAASAGGTVYYDEV